MNELSVKNWVEITTSEHLGNIQIGTAKNIF